MRAAFKATFLTILYAAVTLGIGGGGFLSPLDASPRASDEVGVSPPALKPRNVLTEQITALNDALRVPGHLICGLKTFLPDFARQSHQSLHSTEKSVLVMCYAPTELKWDNDDVDQDVARHVAEHLAANGVRTVDPDRVQLWLKKNADWEKPSEVGAAFGTNFVIHIDLKDYSLFEEHSSDLYRGRADLIVSVLQSDNPRNDDNVIYRRELVSRFPEHAAISVYQQSYDDFKKKHLATLSLKIAGLFCTPEPAAEACIPFISPEAGSRAAALGNVDPVEERARFDFVTVAEEFNVALSQNRLDDALRLANKGKAIQPENPVAEVMVLKSKITNSNAIRRLIALAEIGTVADSDAFDDTAADADDSQLIGQFKTADEVILSGRIERRKLLANLEICIELLNKTRKLSERQREALQRAGRGDIHAFSQRIKRLAPSLRATAEDAPRGMFFFELREDDPVLGKVILLHNELSAGLFGPGSRFGRAASRILETIPRVNPDGEDVVQ